MSSSVARNPTQHFGKVKPCSDLEALLESMVWARVFLFALLCWSILRDGLEFEPSARFSRLVGKYDTAYSSLQERWNLS